MTDHKFKYRVDIAKLYQEEKEKTQKLNIIKKEEDLKKEEIRLSGFANLSAKVINNCENGYIYFVGRSLEGLYDAMRSIFSNLPHWDQKISLFPLSLSEVDMDEFLVVEMYALQDHMKKHYLDPESVIQRSEKTILVDIVHQGRTFTKLFDFYQLWCLESNQSFQDFMKKIKIITIFSFDNAGVIKDFQELLAITIGIDDIKLKKLMTHILINEDFWRDCGDNDDLKLTLSFDDISMFCYYQMMMDEDLDTKPPESIIDGMNSRWASENIRIYAKFQEAKYRKMVSELMRKNRFKRPELKNKSSDPMAWWRSILSHINKTTPVKTHNNKNQVSFKKRKGGKNKARPEKKNNRPTPKEARMQKALENRVEKIVNEVLSLEDGYKGYYIKDLEPYVRNRIIEENFFILRRDDTLTVYNQEKYSLEDLSETYDNNFVGLYSGVAFNHDLKSKKFHQISI